MKTFSSLAAVVALWLGVSFVLWLLYRLFRRRDGSKQKRLAAEALALIDEALDVFAALRTRASLSVPAGAAHNWHHRAEDALREDVRCLLNGIEAQSPYFERVNAGKRKIQKTFGVLDFLPLAEILQIRRDFWAASEIFLIDDIRSLGPELAEAQSYETFQAEARALLFMEDSAEAQTDSDPVQLRLSIAREEAAAFGVQVEETVAAELDRSRFPTPAEIAAVPLNLLGAIAIVGREGRTLLTDAATTAQNFARAVGAKGLKAAAVELRRARGDLPSQFANAFERAGGLARKGGEELKRHYEFLLEAQELRARYAEILARAPVITEKGKQFLARLEIERRAEQFRETSGGAANWARQRIVVGIAYLIRGLQHIQAKVTPEAHKQLAVLAAAVDAMPPSASASEAPLRVLLLPASSYEGGHRGRGTGRASSSKKKPRKAGAEREEPGYKTYRQRQRKPAGPEALAGAFSDHGAAVAEAARRKASPSAAAGSLMERLSSIGSEQHEEPQGLPAAEEKPKQKRQPFRFFS